MSLVREFKIKWWDKFNQNLCSESTVGEFLNSGKKFQHQIQQVSKHTDPPKPSHNASTTIQEDSDSEDEFQQFLKFQEFKKMQKQLTKSRTSSTASSSPIDPTLDPVGGQDPSDM